MSYLGTNNVAPVKALGGRKIGILGTSLCQHNTSSSSSRISHWSRSWISWARVLGLDIVYDVWYDANDTNGRNFTGGNFGVSSQTSDQIIARLQPVLASKCDAIILDNGTNEAGSDTYEEIIANTENIVKAILARGIPVIILPILARGTGSWASGSFSRKNANRVNAWKRHFADKTQGCYFFNWNAYWVDDTSSDGEPIANYSTDDIHINPIGAYHIGKGLKEFLAPYMPPRQRPMVSIDDAFDVTDNPFGNHMPNPMLTGTSGTNGTGSTGDVADDMEVRRTVGSAVTVACTKETRTDGPGDYQVMTFTLSGSAEEQFQFETSTADITHNLAAGNWAKAWCDVDVGAYNGWRGISLYVRDVDGIVGRDLYEFFDSGSYTPWPTEAWSGTLETPPIQLAEGSTELRFRVIIIMDASVAGTPVLKVGAVRMAQVPSPLETYNLA